MTAGRPRAFATVEQLQSGIDKYIESGEPLSIIGLAVSLKVNKDTITMYGSGAYGKEFSVPIKGAVDAIEAQTVAGLIGGKLNPAGCIFILCNNHGYQNKQYRENSGETTKIVKLDAKTAKAIASGLRTAITQS